MATMKTLNGYGFNATEFNGKTSDSYLQLGDDETGSTGAAPTINAGTFGGMTVSQFVEMIYPVGSIYMSVSATSPASLFGGTWESISGRFLLGADSAYSAGSTGGEATHTLTVDEMPGHYNRLKNISWGGESSATVSHNGSYLVYDHNGSTPITNDYYENVGGGAAHNNMPPYLSVYMWQRTA